MYGTLRFDSKSDNDTLIQKPVDPACARPVVQQACESCRTKKVFPPNTVILLSVRLGLLVL
jgi:hypothetical protein